MTTSASTASAPSSSIWNSVITTFTDRTLSPPALDTEPSRNQHQCRELSQMFGGILPTRLLGNDVVQTFDIAIQAHRLLDQSTASLSHAFSLARVHQKILDR